MNGILDITVIEGKSLRKRTNEGIFCSLRIKEKIVSTDSVPHTASPKFDKNNSWKLSLDLYPSDNINLQVLNKVKDAEQNIGEATVSLKTALGTCKEQNLWVDILEKDKIHVGKVNISLNWTPSTIDAVDRSLDCFLGERPGPLRTQYYYDLAKGAYTYVSGFPVASTVAPLLENTAEKVLSISGKVVGIKPEPKERPEDGSPEVEEKEEKATLHALDKQVCNVLHYIDSSIDGLKDTVVVHTKCTKHSVKTYVYDTKDRLSDGVSDRLENAKGSKDYAVERAGDLLWTGYGYVQPWIAPVPVVGKLFKPLEEEEKAQEDSGPSPNPEEEGKVSVASSDVLNDMLSEDSRASSTSPKNIKASSTSPKNKKASGTSPKNRKASGTSPKNKKR